MKKLIPFFFFEILLSCQNKESHPYTFYYWRTHLSLDETEKKELKKATTPYIYARFFDIEKTDGKFSPVAVITKDQTYETSKETVPVVFIKNDVFYGIKIDEINFLAKNVFALIVKKQQEFGLKASEEIQIDCDWTAGTNKEYFAFLKQLKEISGKNINCTLRLHQIYQRELSGIPPVQKVYLMCYSTSSPLENSDKNSILDVQTLKKYLGNVNRYPVELDIALPIYSWGIVTNHLGKHKLINALTSEDLNNPGFKKISDNEAEVLKDGFYFGNYMNKGFRIKTEEISDRQLSEVRKFLDQKLTHYNIVYYHLDSKFVRNHQFK